MSAKAVEVANKAVVLDSQGQFAEAVEMYALAAELMLAQINASSVDQQPDSSVDSLRRRCKEYLDRAEQLKLMVKRRPAPNPPAASSSAAVPRRRPAPPVPARSNQMVASQKQQQQQQQQLAQTLVHRFKHGEKYLQVTPEGLATALGAGGVYCQFMLEPGNCLRQLGSGDARQQPMYLCATANDNIIGAVRQQAESSGWTINCQRGVGRPHALDQKCRVALLTDDGLYLSVRSGGMAVRLQRHCDESCMFQHEVILQHAFGIQAAQFITRGIMNMLAGVRPKVSPLDSPKSVVTAHLLAEYKRNGFVVLRNCVPAELVSKAVAVVNAGLRVDAHKHTRLGGIIRQAWPAEFAEHADILALLHGTPVFSSAEQLVGSALYPVKQAQIAVRFRKADGSKDFGAAMRWHIDGFEKTTTARFASIIQVSLSDWMHDDMGNFTAYPGSHVYLAQLMSTMSWSEWNVAHLTLDLDRLGFKRTQLHLRAGDVILAHPMMAHDVAVNKTDRVRLAAIFRPGFLDPAFRDVLLKGE